MDAQRRPAPWAHLLIDHEITRSLLLAMEEEARRLFDGQALRPAFWEGVLELANDFIERCHRRVEEEVIFPMLLEHGDEQCKRSVSKLAADHGRAHALTDSLCEGIRTGDWEGVLRTAMIYVSNLRKHMEAEEQTFSELADLHLDDAVLAEMRTKAAVIEREALGENGPGHFVELVDQLCEATNVPPHRRPGARPGSSGRHHGSADRQVL